MPVERSVQGRVLSALYRSAGGKEAFGKMVQGQIDAVDRGEGITASEYHRQRKAGLRPHRTSA
ncbi:MAG: hypothetical protein A2798_02915 [Candidatus Levybacteria bacterium RIFCSPHIGHO2_01_FULL_37_17]|nr:MAG: hypothetical protein A2798_02915 [Candidatus Levybacteria bacterium RIFCSPHIGHO2_01_FULL_37_17]OGH36808.1 MAG: hypothetical protein A2959_00905 [Candidatus Levybacteria bacterium RIFCSPLOWO2_01_FULL_38_23]